MNAPGIATKACRRSVDETVRRIVSVAELRQLVVFAIIDHSGEAALVGLEMPNTKLVILGSPAAGTPVMLAAPLAALDLPLKLLVWEDAAGAVFVSYNTPAYLADRYQLADDVRARLQSIETISDAVVAA